MKNCVYRFLDKNENIIYIGRAKNLENRLKGHRHLSEECYIECKYVEYTCFENEDEMELAELYYIKKLKPKYNIIGVGTHNIFNISELDNKKFKKFKKFNKTPSSKIIIEFDDSIKDMQIEEFLDAKLSSAGYVKELVWAVMNGKNPEIEDNSNTSNKKENTEDPAEGFNFDLED